MSIKQECKQRIEEKLNDLVLQWLKTAQCKFIQSKDESDPFAKRFIQHGAICYFNCASQLKKLIKTRNPSPNFIFKIRKKNFKRPGGRRL
jgi:methionyl-tRNA formyltransferase